MKAVAKRQEIVSGFDYTGLDAGLAERTRNRAARVRGYERHSLKLFGKTVPRKLPKTR